MTPPAAQTPVSERFDAEGVADCAVAAAADAAPFDAPYRHWIARGLVPDALLSEIGGIDFPAPDLAGVSGKRELHNDQRHYVDEANMARHPAMAALGEAFQSRRVVDAMERAFGAALDGTFLRIEYALDVDGFWLQPHTDLGVKRLTILLYIADAPGQDDLGTDIYDGEKRWAKRTPFETNAALVFVPGEATYHGFEPRAIDGVRKSLIINYVTGEWRDREQLAFPRAPVRSR